MLVMDLAYRVSVKVPVLLQVLTIRPMRLFLFGDKKIVYRRPEGAINVALIRFRRMKVVILAGGLGTRLAEETTTRPKPMVEIGGKPILWHIMKSYAHFGITDFVICLGYKGEMIKDFFTNQETTDQWRIELVDTGDATQTGGRLKRVRPHLGTDDFCMTYGDGLADVNIHQLLAFHRTEGCLATVTAVRPPARFGRLELGDPDSKRVTGFQEKPRGDGNWINGGFFMLSPTALDLIADDATLWEKEPMQKLAASGQIAAFRHEGFWQPMDTLRDKHHLEELWQRGNAPWKQWS